VTRFITPRYSRQGLWSLFLVCAFPLHLWTLILSFRDISWVAERTSAWDAIGVVSYGMLFTFFESVLIFLFVAVLGFLLPRQWSTDKRISLLSLLILIASIWAMISQLLFLWNIWLPAGALEFLRNSDHPFRIVYAACLAVVTATALLPVYLFLRAEKSVAIMQNVIERLSLLTMFYLFFDLLGIIIILMRNLSW
jgi:hypothetical protein